MSGSKTENQLLFLEYCLFICKKQKSLLQKEMNESQNKSNGICVLQSVLKTIKRGLKTIALKTK